MPLTFRRPAWPWAYALLLSALTIPAFAQSTFLLRGTVRDGRTREPLLGATVAAPALNRGTATGPDGTYELTLPTGEPLAVRFTFLGYKTVIRTVRSAGPDVTLAINLTGSENQLDEAVVEGTQEKLADKLKSTQMSVERLTIAEAKLLPALFGEVDILKTLQLKPGVQNGGEGTTGLFVRGGSNDQNLVLLDGALVYNPQHLFGLFSVFNPDAVSSVDLYKGGFPAQFGGRLSSVVDVKSRDGADDRWHAQGGIGLVSSRLTLEGPLPRLPWRADTTATGARRRAPGTLILAGRRTYFDIFTRQLNRVNEGVKDYDPIPDYYFQDFNAKASWVLSDRDRLTLTGYLGRDIFGFKSPNGFDFSFRWGNTVGSARWTRTLSPTLVLVTTASSSNYRYEIANRFQQFSFNLSSRVNDLALRSDLLWTPNPAHAVQAGVAATGHRFGVGRLQAGGAGTSIIPLSDITYYGTEYGVYAQDDWTVSPRVVVSGGLRLSAFANGRQVYAAPEPRAALRFSLTNHTSLKASYTRMQQYVHLVTNSGASLPTDVWYPSNKTVRPQRAQQAALGVSHLFGHGHWLFTQELYYKWMNRVVDFRDGAQIFVNPDLDREFLFGKGTAYGSEFYLERKDGRLTGWVGYTLAWANRRFDDFARGDVINGGRTFPTTYDQRHNLTAVGIFKLSRRLHFTSSFVYSTGRPTTLAVARIAFQDIAGNRFSYVPVYPDRNQYRLANYHRLDLGVVLRMRPRHGESDLTLSIYNAYNRRNAYFVYYEDVRDERTDQILRFRARQVSLFPIIPALTYNFKF
ncbi:MAG: TonB-dependent receptor [Hymenobacteraceae bacterium]|nr:TonB-dependent receptor [Hymenobacteraceae bacterium]